MKLYLKPGACSLSPHIVLCELGLPHETEVVDTKAGKTAGGVDFSTINPKGFVPALALDNGEVLTEGPAIVQYLAEQKPEAGLLPPPATLARARVQELLNFIGTDIHKSFTPLFRPEAADGWKATGRANIERHFTFLNKVLDGRAFLTGDAFTVADAYLFTVLGWTKFVNIDLAPWPNLVAYQQRIAARPAVQAALKSEGLI